MVKKFANSIETVENLMESNEITPIEVIEEFYARILKLEPTIKAFAHLRSKDDVIQEVISKMNKDNSSQPLLGISYAVKDNVHVDSLPLEAGSKILKGYISDKNATIIERLNKAGAIMIGKAAMAEFASGGGAPKTKNPWNFAHTPGGSSMGSASALSSDMLMFSIGTQTSGSVIRPASYNGLTALKPTFGQISKAGIIPASWSVDGVGIFTKNVKDLKYVYNEIAGFDIKDHCTYSYKDKILYLTDGDLSKRFKIGIISDDYFIATDEVMTAFTEAVHLLESQGHSITATSMPASFEQANIAHGIVVDSETASYHASYFDEKKDLFSSELRFDIEQGLSYSAVDYLQAQETRWKYKCAFKKVFDKVDLLITPATTETAPKGLEKTGSPKFNKPFSNAGLPVLTLPIGFSDETDLPIGIQIIANYDCEQSLVDLGEQLQTEFDYQNQSPNLNE
ncbi:amidase [Oceanobacillus sojae]|uniref:amidase n=1 Tax=Oceanobacillus sojae TaxID=582851 RepID=UPI001588D252|nr:amidase [Oceanobacillus sojae]